MIESNASDTVSAAVRKRWMIEVAVVICVAVLPDFVSSLLSFFSDVDWKTYLNGDSLVPSQISLIFRSVSALAAVGFIIWASSEPLANFGIVRFRAALDLGGAAALVVGAYTIYWFSSIAYWAVAGFWQGVTGNSFDIPETAESPEYSVDGYYWPLIVFTNVLNSMAEETVISGFLLVRLTQITGNKWLALAIASCCFASYHLYQGWWSAGMVLLMGMMHGLWFIAFRRLWPLVIAHTTYNLIIWALW